MTGDTYDAAVDGAADVDVKRRRRGADLEAAIRQAAVAELLEHGYSRLTMDAVAARAHTGKATLYRRWPDKQALVLDAIERTLPQIPDRLSARGLRGELLEVHLILARNLAGPGGALARALIAAQEQSPQLMMAVQEQLLRPREEVLLSALRRAAERGELEPAVATLHLAQVGPALLLHHFLVHGAEGIEAAACRVVDEVLLPLTGAAAGRH